MRKMYLFVRMERNRLNHASLKLEGTSEFTAKLRLYFISADQTVHNDEVTFEVDCLAVESKINRELLVEMGAVAMTLMPSKMTSKIYANVHLSFYHLLKKPTLTEIFFCYVRKVKFHLRVSHFLHRGRAMRRLWTEMRRNLKISL